MQIKVFKDLTADSWRRWTLQGQSEFTLWVRRAINCWLSNVLFSESVVLCLRTIGVHVYQKWEEALKCWFLPPTAPITLPLISSISALATPLAFHCSLSLVIHNTVDPLLFKICIVKFNFGTTAPIFLSCYSSPNTKFSNRPGVKKSTPVLSYM